MFVSFGGHEGACGFTMQRENLAALKNALNEDIDRLLEENPSLFEQTICADMELEGEQISVELAEELECLAPFGNKNPKPKFMLGQAEIFGPAPMGDGTHIRFTASCADGYDVPCVLFGRAKEFESLIFSGLPVNIIGSMDFQEWKGNKRVQFQVDTILED
jgi:single-stranded-DNA-specific exonuclease